MDVVSVCVGMLDVILHAGHRIYIPLLQEHDRTEDKTTYGSHMRIHGKKLSLYVTLASQHKLPAAVFEVVS